MEIGGIAKAGIATITNSPGRAESRTASSVVRTSVDVSAVSWRTSATRTVT